MSTWYESVTPEEYPERAPTEIDPDAERPAFRTLLTPMTREEMEMAIRESERQYDAILKGMGR